VLKTVLFSWENYVYGITAKFDGSTDVVSLEKNNYKLLYEQ